MVLVKVHGDVELRISELRSTNGGAKAEQHASGENAGEITSPYECYEESKHKPKLCNKLLEIARSWSWFGKARGQWEVDGQITDNRRGHVMEVALTAAILSIN
jgi:hypothetical protein